MAAQDWSGATVRQQWAETAKWIGRKRRKDRKEQGGRVSVGSRQAGLHMPDSRVHYIATQASSPLPCWLGILSPVSLCSLGIVAFSGTGHLVLPTRPQLPVILQLPRAEDHQRNTFFLVQSQMSGTCTASTLGQQNYAQTVQTKNSLCPAHPQLPFISPTLPA